MSYFVLHQARWDRLERQLLFSWSVFFVVTSVCKRLCVNSEECDCCPICSLTPVVFDNGQNVLRTAV